MHLSKCKRQTRDESIEEHTKTRKNLREEHTLTEGQFEGGEQLRPSLRQTLPTRVVTPHDLEDS